MTLTAAETADALEYELHIAAAPNTVWALWIDPDRLVQWMGRIATLEPSPVARSGSTTGRAMSPAAACSKRMRRTVSSSPLDGRTRTMLSSLG